MRPAKERAHKMMAAIIAGRTMKEIAEEHGVSTSRVGSAVLMFVKQMRYELPQGYKYPQTLQEVRADGKLLMEVAARYEKLGYMSPLERQAKSATPAAPLSEIAAHIGRLCDQVPLSKRAQVFAQVELLLLEAINGD